MGTSASFARKIAACLLAALLSLALVPASALAEETSEADTEAVASGSPDQSTDSADSVILSEGTEGPEVEESNSRPLTLASGLVGKPSNFINSDVALDGEPVIGSFTVDGLTYAVISESTIELVGVSPNWQQVTNSLDVEDASVAPMLASGSDGDESDAAALVLPETVTYEGTTYTLASIAPYAFYLSGVTDVTLPASVSDVDDRAFRSSDVASVTVAEGNPAYSSFDGALYSADRSSLLLIPEGKQGAVLLPKETEVVEAGKFSHYSLVEAISAEDGAAFASENGLLYDASLTTLLRVPAGATEIAIREGCTTIAAGAMEGCAKLTTINAPASVTSISPDIFTSVPTTTLPAAALTENTLQLTALVALSSIDDGLPEVYSSGIRIILSEDADDTVWQQRDFRVESANSDDASSMAGVQSSSVVRAGYATIYGNCLYAHASWNNTYYYYPDSFFGIPGGLGAANVFASTATSATVTQSGSGATVRRTFYNPGCTFVCYSTSNSYPGGETWQSGTRGLPTATYLIWRVPITWDANGGYWEDDRSDTQSKTDTYYSNDLTSGWQGGIVPKRPGYRFTGWRSIPPTSSVSQLSFAPGEDVAVSYAVTYVAQWEQGDLDLGFDVDSEPSDEAYPGIEKPDQTVTGDQIGSGEKVEIGDPKRPGYVFQGWTIPNAEGTEAIDQDLVYEGEDGKWYVDASKLPDYADGSGRVELTARWTSVISVDVPSSVTFYADVVTEGQESREGAASSAFGQNKVASQSQVDLRIVGLESQQVRGDGSTTLGASDILGKKDGGAVSGTADKILSLYPTDEALAPDDLQDPGAVSAVKPADAVDFALDDILLEGSFADAAEKFTIPSGGTLNLGYRLNLSETGTELDYDKLSTLGEGQSASIANISYCFAADAWPAFWTYDDNGRMRNIYAIKADAEAIAAGDSTAVAKYTDWMNADHRFYMRWFDKGVSEVDADSEDDSSVYEVRIIGLNHDDRSDGSGKAGITFQLVDCLNATYRQGTSIAGGWQRSELRARMNPSELTSGIVVNGSDDDAIWNQVPEMLQDNLVTVAKGSNDRQSWNSPIVTTDNKFFLLCMKEYFPHTLTASVTGFYVIPAELDSYNSTTGGFGMEGSTYDYYVSLGCPYCNSAGSAAGPASAVAKKVGGTLSSMWVRSLSISDQAGNRFNYIKSNGAVWDSVVTNAHGVSPAFCL